MPDPNTAPASSQAAPAATPAAQVPATAATQQSSGPAPAPAQAHDFNHDDIIKAAQFEVSPAEELARYKRDYAASSTEARRLKAVSDSFITELSKQGLKPVFDSKGNFKGLEADDKWEPDVSLKLPKLSDLSKAERELFNEDPEKGFEAYQARVGEVVKKALVRAKPTVEPQAKVEPIAAERLDSEIAFLAERKMDGGDPRYEGFSNKTLATVKSAVQDFARNIEGFQDFLNRSPAIAVQFVADRIAHSTARWQVIAQKSQAQKTQQETQRSQATATQSTASGQATVESGKQAATAQYEQGYDAILKRGTLA